MITTVDRPDGVEGVRIHRAARAGPRVVLVGRQHGNEPVGQHVIERFTEAASAHLSAGTVVTVLANLEAARLDVRHTPDGRDMNRLWDADTLARLAASDAAGLCYEERRVRELAPHVRGADVLLDLHSTSRPSPPHLLFRDDLDHARLAAKLGVTRLITGIHEGGILDGGLCSDVGLHPGAPSTWVGLTLEAGQHEEPRNLEAAWRVVVRLLGALEMWSGEVPHHAVPYEVYDIIDRFRQAPAGTAPYRFVGYAGGEPGGDRHGPPRRLESFDAIEADEILLRRGADEVVRAEAPFTMLMPAPTAGPGEDLYYVCQRRHAALGTRPSDDAEAAVEARAIERVMDLLAWDEAQAGTTVVTTTNRRTLDLCAEMVLRTMRLPVGHPHRRITIVGRGDWSDDEHELRIGSRWHGAVRQALEAGVAVERIQFLRGTSLGWMGQLATLGEAATGTLRLRLAQQQPHTVAVLLVGDAEAALASGELRHVGVGLVIEAATPEPDGDDVHVRVSRAGVFGSRPALVRTAKGLVRLAQREHTLHLADVPGALSDHLADDGALDLTADPHAVAHALLGLQLARYREALTTAVPKATTVPRGRLGAWLVRTMTATGILDPHALRGLLVRPTDDGWSVDPARLSAPPPLARCLPHPKAMPRPVLTASQVDVDNIDRWIGWKRFLREAQTLPGERGRDLDLAFRSDQIQGRVARWMDEARALAVREPGRWLVAITGDGLSPHREGESHGWDVLWAHRRVVFDPRLHYVRVQHAQGTHLGWWKDLVGQVQARDPSGVPASLGWETEHGGSIHVMLVARLREGQEATAWSLESWTVERCAVLVSDPTGHHAYPVSLFTEPGEDGRVNQPLAHFGRSHVDRLMRQASWRFRGAGGPTARVQLAGAGSQLVGDQVAALAPHRATLEALDERARTRWTARRLGLRDRAFARAVQAAVMAGEAPADAGRRVWSEVEAWPGAVWDELGRLD